jgi:multidrug efflux pump subunit AcrB
VNVTKLRLTPTSKTVEIDFGSSRTPLPLGCISPLLPRPLARPIRLSADGYPGARGAPTPTFAEHKSQAVRPDPGSTGGLVRRWLALPHLLLSLALTGAAVGVYAFFQLPLDLFPDSERPQVAVVTVWPGATATDVEAEITRVLEVELAGLDELRQLTSTSRDELSLVTAELGYTKSLDEAAAEVATTLDRVVGSLPADARQSMLFKVSAATPAVVTLALRPAAGSPLDLTMVRQMAENEIRERLLRLESVARVEVFGGHQPVALVEPDPARLAAHALTVDDLATALVGRARNQPFGRLESARGEELLVRLDARATVEELRELVVASRPGGALRLADVAAVRYEAADPTSLFHSGGEPAIAVNVQRGVAGNVLGTAAEVLEALPGLARDFPGVEIEVADNQGELIELSMGNMRWSLAGAIVATMLVLFLFLGDRRVTLLAGVSLPLTFLLTFAAMWLLGLELNLVTLTAIIVAVGMLVDNSVVVIENIVRQRQEAGEAPEEAAAIGASEVALAILGGTLTTIVVLVPILFVGGFVETILRPFATTLILAIGGSYLVAVTVIPLLAPRLLASSRERLAPGLDARVGAVGARFSAAVASRAAAASRWALGHRRWVLLGALALLVVSGWQLPLLGRDLLPPMDTGVVKVAFDAPANASYAEVRELLTTLEGRIQAHPEVVSISAAVGSEADVTSFGAGRTLQQGVITVDLVDRFRRQASIWEVQERMHADLEGVPGLSSLALYEHGATPFSTMRATVDVELAGPDSGVLDLLASEVEERLRSGLRGATSVRRSWHRDRHQAVFVLDAEAAGRVGSTPEAVSRQVADWLRPRPGGSLRIPTQRGLPVELRLPAQERSDAEGLLGRQVMTPAGAVPLGALGHVEPMRTAPLVTRRDLQRTVSVTATRGRASVTHLQEDVEATLEGLELPAGYSLAHRGEIAEMWEAFGRLGGALALSLVLLYGVLVPTFRSWRHPVTVLSVVPLAAAGGLWALMVAMKSASMPAFMGVILLGGVAVNTSILLLDVMERLRREGLSRDRAIEEAIRRRTRPILMTTVSTLVGMLPVALETAVGLERLSPLAIVSIGGLLVSSLLVLVLVPVVATVLEDATAWIGRFLASGRSLEAEAR